MIEAPRRVEKIYTHQCEDITRAGRRCKCFGVEQINGLWYCELYAKKLLREAKDKSERRTECD
jgi:hypothetical protein